MPDSPIGDSPIAEIAPIYSSVVGRQGRSLLAWGLALAAISAMYLGFYPSMGGDAMDDLVADLPDEMVTALGYDTIGTAGGWVTSTVYGLLGPALLLIFVIGIGARLLAGEEEAGTLELEVTAPVSRSRVLAERLAAMVTFVLALVGVVTVVSWVLITALDMDVPIDRLLAGSAGLALLVLGFGTIAFAVGAVTGRRPQAIGIAAALAVAAFMFDALGPVVEVQWMSDVSPFYWYLGNDPLIDGFDVIGLIKLATISVLAVVAATVAFPRRDLNV
ncbi:MAG: ABC transporter permease [Acidimicrobiales bacterium]